MILNILNIIKRAVNGNAFKCIEYIKYDKNKTHLKKNVDKTNL